MSHFNCIIALDRRDPRWSIFGDGDELLVAVTTSLEAAKAVGRLFGDAQPVQIWRSKWRVGE